MPVPEDLPVTERTGLATFHTAAREAFGDDIVAVVLFGSAVDGRLARFRIGPRRYRPGAPVRLKLEQRSEF